jgi:hypothetical protein
MEEIKKALKIRKSALTRLNK